MRSARYAHAAAGLAGGRVLVAGGTNSSRLNSADVYDATTGLFSTFVFNPRAFQPPLDSDKDNIYHFKTITIPAGITVRLSGDVINGPVYWLASGPVTIDGTLDLSGGSGHPTNITSPSQRIPSGAGQVVSAVAWAATRPHLRDQVTVPRADSQASRRTFEPVASAAIRSLYRSSVGPAERAGW